MDIDASKMEAARRSVEFVKDGMVVGLGSGTTATQFIRLLGERVGHGLKIRGIASSLASEKLAESLGIPITDFRSTPHIDVAIDGADEVGPGLALIKGGGGALLREKIVASASSEFIVVADARKRVAHLGHFPLPVEVIQMASPLVERKLAALGVKPTLRRTATGEPFITDEGNVLLDCACGEIDDPERLAAAIRSIVGVVEHGLFLRMASIAIIADNDSITELRP